MSANNIPYLAPIAITPAQALVVTGLSNARTAQTNARTQIYRGTYPFPLTPIPTAGSRKYVVLVRDIKATLGLTEDNALAASLERAEPHNRKRGRPRLSQTASKGACE